MPRRLDPSMGLDGSVVLSADTMGLSRSRKNRKSDAVVWLHLMMKVTREIQLCLKKRQARCNPESCDSMNMFLDFRRKTSQ